MENETTTQAEKPKQSFPIKLTDGDYKLTFYCVATTREEAEVRALAIFGGSSWRIVKEVL